MTYTADPVDIDHQSLVISAPVRINGVEVDSSAAPILFANAVSGYLPVTIKGATGVGQSMGVRDANQGNLPQLALAAGYVAVEPGCRGRSLVDSNGVYYGTAPAAIVDLKAAVRFLRANVGAIPGDVERIVSSGTSAGGALSALLGASADSPLYSKYLDELGAANSSDAVYACGAWCPITDLGHADGAYEWNWGSNPTSDGPVDPMLSRQLWELFSEYQASLALPGLDDFGILTAHNYADYLLKNYLQPSAQRHLLGLSAADRRTYLQQNSWIRFNSDVAAFSWQNYLTNVGMRRKALPAFDAFDLSAGENNLFGIHTTAARHFTDFSAAHATAGEHLLDGDIPLLTDLMNPMHFIGSANLRRARHWWIRVGTKDTDTSLTISANLAAALASLGDDVNSLMYWDGGHGVNNDAGDFIGWVGAITR
jgi:hypothetical protein